MREGGGTLGGLEMCQNIRSQIEKDVVDILYIWQPREGQYISFY